MLEGGALDMVVSSDLIVDVVCVEYMVKVVAREVVMVSVVPVEDVKLVMEESSSSDCEPIMIYKCLLGIVYGSQPTVDAIYIHMEALCQDAASKKVFVLEQNYVIVCLVFRIQRCYFCSKILSDFCRNFLVS